MPRYSPPIVVAKFLHPVSIFLRFGLVYFINIVTLHVYVIVIVISININVFLRFIAMSPSFGWLAVFRIFLQVPALSIFWYHGLITNLAPTSHLCIKSPPSLPKNSELILPNLDDLEVCLRSPYCLIHRH